MKAVRLRVREAKRSPRLSRARVTGSGAFYLVLVGRPCDQPRLAASIAAISIFFMSIIASNARFAAAGSGSLIACVSAIGVICQDRPHLSLHQPHALSAPPFPTIAFQ